MKRVRILPSLFTVLAVLGLSAPARAGATASDSWGAVVKYIAINPGTSVSVWKEASRSLVTNGSVSMTPVGDGTYEYIVGLNAGQSYNYIFYAQAGWPAPPGLVAWNEYYDVMPANGVIRCSSNGKTWNMPDTTAYYSSVNYDARRVLNIPGTMAPGDTLYVFNNFAETPGTVNNFFAAAEGDTQIRLTWDGVYGHWGTGGEAFKAADVLAGGTFEIYRGTNESGPFTRIATIDGLLSTFLDSNLVAGDTYYYCVRALDAYRGLTVATDTFPRLRGDTSTVRYARARGAIRTFFIVRDADWGVLENRGGLAWFSDPVDPPWGEKIAVRIARVYLPGPGRLR